MEQSQKIMCPSSRCQPGASLLGVRQESGVVAILPQPLAIDQAFVDVVKEEATLPEQKFRFTNKCVENGCVQWNGKGCGVIDKIMDFLDEVPEQVELPPCSIRSNCRWFLQKGREACRLCPYIATEITAEEGERYFNQGTSL